MAGPSNIVSLPAELLTRVFEYLGEHRPDVSACRLVNQRFKELSSPFLITKVVLAKRLREIAKVHEVACHPYFSRHVTGLIYDVSYFDPYSASFYDNYVDDCESIEDSGVRRFLDADWLRRARAESDFYASCISNKGEPSLDAAAAFFQRLDSPLTESQSLELVDEASRDSILATQGETANIADRMGARQSFPIYKRFHFVHQSLDTSGEYGRIIRQAISKFPKLRHVHFTDYRELARPGECYMDLCTRLFGNVREPERWNNLEHNGDVTEEILEAWKIIMQVKGELRSVSLGPHPFEQRCNSTDPLALYKESQFMSTDEFKDHPKRLNEFYHEFAHQTDLSRCRITGEPIPHRDWAGLFNGLKSLRLPLFFEESLPPLSEGVGQELCRLFAAIPETIANLALTAKGPIDGFLQHQGGPASLQALQPFNSLVTTLHLPHLRSLELEGWVTDYSTLYAFIGAHAPTLRTLHLIDIFACGNPYLWKGGEYEMGEADEEEDMYPFGEFIRSNLHLTGIEIHHFEHQRYPAGSTEGLNQHSWLVDPLETTPGDWDEDREVMEDRLFDDDDDSKASILDSPRLERLCLGGRPNLIHRRVRPGTWPPGASRVKSGEDDAMADKNVRPKQWRGPGYYWTRRPAYR
jgi:hypothetical protein